MEGIEETVAAGRAAFTAAGAADRLGTFYEPGPHEFSPAMREAAYAWLGPVAQATGEVARTRASGGPAKRSFSTGEPDDGQQRQHAAHDQRLFSFGGCMPIAIRARHRSR